MSFVMLLMNLAPIGIFCLVASRFGEAQAKGEFIETLSQTGSFVLTVLIGLGASISSARSRCCTGSSSERTPTTS